MSNPPTHRARKRFGQNFLHDSAVIDKIISAIDPGENDHVIEIGPGKGALTEHLLKRVARLDIIEIDRDLAAMLEQQFDSNRSQLHLHLQDALTLELSTFNNNSLRIVGNLPYNISTPLLFHLLDQTCYISDMTFMLQKEVVDRMAASPNSKTYGRLSVMLQYACEVESLFTVKPGAFNPAPRVDSAVVRIVPNADKIARVQQPRLMARLVRDAFSQRRKTIRNSLKSHTDERLMIDLGIDPAARAENLTVEDYIKLSNRLAHTETSE